MVWLTFGSVAVLIIVGVIIVALLADAGWIR